ncbi:MAG TPA: hypothetical protein VNI01_16135, partial [Elusimicrobiota bacterium]|nr:hypothetical protein [Elusimicrobiota bacterium]
MARRAPPFRRTCALALSASLLLSSWQAPALARAEDAAPPPMSTEQAMQALTNGGFFANDRDNRLRAMVTTPEGGLTPFGETVARMYSANQTIDREEVARVRESGRELPAGIENNLLMGDMMRQHRDQLQRIANSNADPRIIQLEMRAALRDMRRDFGDVANLRPGGNGENIDPIAGSVLVSAGFDGASRAQRQYNARELRVMENGNTLSVFAPNGELLFAEDKDKRKIFDQRVFEAQRTARASLRNASNPELLACANDVNATGVLDYSYLNFQRCQVMLSIQAARRERELQQVQAMAALLGEHPKPEDVDSPGKVTALLNRYKEMTVRTGTFIPSWVPLRSDLLGVNLESGMPTAWSMISDRFQRSGTHLEKAQTDYEEYERLVNSYRGASEITREQLQTLQDLEGRVRRSLTMAQLEGFNFKIDQYLELLSYSVKRDANGFPTDLIGSAPNPSSRE